jgi:tRNA(Leu) C34 or U34 (ribose-2'-O)-methylase TrmL
VADKTCENPTSRLARLFRHRRRGNLQGRQSRQSAALGACLRRELRVHLGADETAIEIRHDTSKAWTHLPVYHWRSLADLKLPKGCSLVGVEILEAAHDLPSFPHPLRAAYVLGPERGALSPELAARCQHLVRIPAAFSLNLATAGAIVMYDRLPSLGRFGSRPVAEHAEAPEPRPHVQGAPKRRRRQG